MPQSQKFLSRIQSWAQPVLKPAPMAGFGFHGVNSATIVPRKYITYRPPKIVKGKKRWYVEYWYRVPVELRDRYKKEFERFRVFEDINRYKNNEYASLLRDAVELALNNGWSPFEDELEEVAPQGDTKAEWSLNFGLEQYIADCKEKKLRPKTVQSYTTIVNFLKEYFYKDNKIFKPLSDIKRDHIKDFLRHYSKLHSWTATTYNNYLGYTSAIFNWFVAEEKLEKSPVKGIKTKKATVTRHKFYDEATADALKKDISKSNPYLFSFVLFTYYTAIRPKSEARFIKIKHLLFDRNLIHIPAEVAKNKQGDFVPMAEELKAMLIAYRDLPPETYLWGLKGPAAKPASQNHFASLYKPFKDKHGLGPDYSIYSWKHTRNIHLALAGASPYDIMRFNRHSSLEQTMNYLRDLGLTDYSEVLKKGGKF